MREPALTLITPELHLRFLPADLKAARTHFGKGDKPGRGTGEGKWGVNEDRDKGSG